MRAVKWMLATGLCLSFSLVGCDCGGPVDEDAGTSDGSVVYDAGRTDTTVVDSATTDTAVADTAVTDTSIADTAVADTAVTDAAGTDAAGTDAAGTDAAGTDAAGTDAAGTDAAGTDAAGTDAAGTDAAGTDAAGTDAATVEDAGVTEDAGSYTCTTIADVRTTGNGSADLYLCDVYVTYTRTIGYMVQDAPTGPAIFVYTDPASPTGLHIAVGNQIDLHITSLSAFQGVKQIDESSVVTNDNGSYDVRANLRQDLSAGAGTALGEDLESELVGLVNARVVSGVGRNWIVEYGSGNLTAELYAYEAPTPALCPGATFTLLSGYVSESNGSYEIASFYASDFGSVNDTNCITYDDSNWDFEDFSTSPIDDFVYPLVGLTATSETTLKHGGNASANLTWTTTDNVDFRSGYLYPIDADTQYSCHFWLLDNDTGGQARVFISWYDADGAFISNSFPAGQAGYTANSPDWAEYTRQATSPASAAFMTCGIRLYDVAANWDGNATIYVDDLSISSP